MSAPSIHVAIIAWRRPECTARTIESFRRHNGWYLDDPWHVWAGIDGDADPKTRAVLEEHHVEILVEHDEHVGIDRTQEALVAAIAERGHPNDWLLLLQNDWVSLRPVPIDAVAEALCWGRRGRAWVWLVGLWKEADRQRRQDGLDRAFCRPYPPMHWELRWAGEEPALWSVGPGYWGPPPSVARLGILNRVLAAGRPGRAKLETYYRAESHRLGYRTAWFLDSVFQHVGQKGYKLRGGKRC